MEKKIRRGNNKGKTFNKRTSARAKIAINNIVGSRGSLGKALLDAGYSKAYSTNPKQFLSTKSVQADILEVTAMLKEGRTRAFREAMSPKKLARASAYTAALTGDILAKNERLFEGKATEIIKHELDHLDDDALTTHIETIERAIRRSTGGKEA